MWKAFKEMMEESFRKSSKKKIIVFLTLRSLVILVMIREFFLQNYFNCLLCIFSLFLFILPAFIEKQLKIDLPNTLEIIIYVFIFAAEILGEIENFYDKIPIWDTILHTTNGFCCAAIGFSLVDLLNRNSKRIDLSPMYLAIVAFCFSMTIGVCWEFIEFFGDQIFRMDMQKDTMIHSIASVTLNPDHANVPVIIDGIEKTELTLEDGTTYTIEGGYLDIGIIDTMQDLFVNFIGAITFSTIGYFYVKHRDKNSFASQMIPVITDESGIIIEKEGASALWVGK